MEEEERSSNGDPDEVSTATRAKQRAEGLKVKVLKILRDLGRVTVVVLLGLAGKVCSMLRFHRMSPLLGVRTEQLTHYSV